MEKIDYYFEKISGKWEKRSTLFKLICLLVTIYFLLGDYLLKDKFERLSLINSIVLLTIIIITATIWYITTKRLPISFKNELKFAILVCTDDEKVDDKIKGIITDCLININEAIEDAQVILLPLNYINNEKEIKQFLDTRGFSIETLIYMKLSSGNFIDEKITYEKITIDEIKCFAKVEINKNKKIYRSDVNLVPDIKLSNYHKNWDYLEANSKADKHKYKTNLSELILQYISIYYIYLDEFESSLNILTRIHNQKEDLINPRKNNFKIGRFNLIILELFFKVSVDYYYKHQNYKKCYDLMLMSLNLIGDNHDMIFDCYVNLAITAYKLDNLKEAKLYTQKAKTKQPNSSIIIINEAFFSILDNNPLLLAKKYRQLKLRFSILKETNVLDVIEFISIEKSKFVKHENHILFEFAEGFLFRNYADEHFGITILEEFIKSYPNSNNFNEELFDLAKASILTKQSKTIKGNYRKAS